MIESTDADPATETWREALAYDSARWAHMPTSVRLRQAEQALVAARQRIAELERELAGHCGAWHWQSDGDGGWYSGPNEWHHGRPVQTVTVDGGVL